MKLTVDQEADALHFRFVDMPVAESDEIAPGVIVDYDESKQVIGIEGAGALETTTSGKPNGFSISGHREDSGSD